MTNPVTRIGDTGSHGGIVVTGSHNCCANSIPVSRIGDMYACPIHGLNPIVTGSPFKRVNSRNTSRVGSLTACGAVIISGSPDHPAE